MTLVNIILARALKKSNEKNQSIAAGLMESFVNFAFRAVTYDKLIGCINNFVLNLCREGVEVNNEMYKNILLNLFLIYPSRLSQRFTILYIFQVSQIIRGTVVVMHTQTKES